MLTIIPQKCPGNFIDSSLLLCCIISSQFPLSIEEIRRLALIISLTFRPSVSRLSSSLQSFKRSFPFVRFSFEGSGLEHGLDSIL